MVCFMISDIGVAAADVVQELLGAAFDWEPALHDAAAALATLGKQKDEAPFLPKSVLSQVIQELLPLKQKIPPVPQ